MADYTFPAVDPQLAGGEQHVYVKTNWADAWVEVDDLFCTNLTFASAPGIGTAQFYFRFGKYLKSGDTNWQTVDYLNFNPRTYVKVTVEPRQDIPDVDGFTWYGIWRRARLRDSQQFFTADGIEKLLDVPMYDSPYVSVGGDLRWAGRGLQFNAGGKPNKSTVLKTVNTIQTYVFDEDTENAEYWNTKDAATLILALSSPQEANGDSIIDFVPNFFDLPSFDRVNVVTHGVTYWRLLNSLIPQHKLTGFAIDVDTGTDVPTARAFTFNSVAIDFKDDVGNPIGTLDANPDQHTIDIAEDQSAQASLSIEASSIADRVTVTCDNGRQIVFTVSNPDGSLLPRWTLGEQTDYKDVLSSIPGYAGLDIDQQERRKSDARSVDKFSHVFSMFGPPDAWDQQIKDGEGVGADVSLAVEDDDPNTQFFIYQPDLIFQPRLPLLTSHDYSDAIIGDAEASDHEGHRGTPLGDGPYEERPLFVAFKVYEKDPAVPGDADRWQFGDALGRVADVEAIPEKDGEEPADRRYSVDARPIRDEAAIELRVHGHEQHAIAHDEMFGHADYIKGSLGWQRSVVTLAVIDPRPIVVVWPEPDELGEFETLGEFVGEIFVEVQDYKLIDVRPNTVVDVDPYTLQLVRSDGGLLQDDRPIMRVIAQRLYDWHKTPRYALQFSTGYIDGRIKIGHLITEYTSIHGTSSVDSVVTEISIDFERSRNADVGIAKVTYSTDFGQMDAEQIAPLEKFS